MKENITPGRYTYPNRDVGLNISSPASPPPPSQQILYDVYKRSSSFATASFSDGLGFPYSKILPTILADDSCRVLEIPVPCKLNHTYKPTYYTVGRQSDGDRRPNIPITSSPYRLQDVSRNAFSVIASRIGVVGVRISSLNTKLEIAKLTDDGEISNWQIIYTPISLSNQYISSSAHYIEISRQPFTIVNWGLFRLTGNLGSETTLAIEARQKHNHFPRFLNRTPLTIRVIVFNQHEAPID